MFENTPRDQFDFWTSDITDNIKALEKKIKNLYAENSGFRKRIEMLEAQFNIQGQKVVQPRVYEPKKKPSEVFPHFVDLNEYQKNFNDTMWKMFELIGTTGVAKHPDIERVFCEQNHKFAKSQLRRAAEALVSMNVLTRTKLKLPLSPITNLYSLSEVGDCLFRKKFNTAPVPSEMVKIIKEHDNIEHGYGILDLAQLLANSRKYKEVCAFNRTQPVKFTDGTQYIPDVMCLNHDGKTKTYFEYERGHHSQKNFNEKCDKMRIATKILNFVAPNQKDMVKRLYPLVEEWVKAKGVSEYNDYAIRLTTARTFQKCHLSDQSWLIVFDPTKSLEPITCTVDLD